MDKIKGMIHNTNFIVGSNSSTFERKETATIDSPSFEQTVVSPWPYKNTSTLKLKYH